uniref:G_PROTEIN_RECEP_F1_2 domain-containing protein n=1 Tax=Strongyloides papillosus TaxID=174720 RepID=A0A0N5B1T8_STREA
MHTNMTSSIFVTAESSWIYSACIYTFVPLIFYIINSTIIVLAFHNKTLKEKKDLRLVLIFSASINIISMVLYGAFAYLWWFCYLTTTYINIKTTTLVAEVRLFGMGILFISPLILSIWRYFLIVRNWNLNIWKCSIGYLILLSFHAYAFCDKAFVSEKISKNDIFTYSITYSSPYTIFFFLLTDIIAPIVAIIFLIAILIHIKRHQESIKDIVISKVRKNVGRQQRIIVYSLIIMSGIPLLGAIPHYLMRIFFIYKYHIPRIGWNITEFIILSVGGSAPLCMVLVLPTLKNAFIEQLGFRIPSSTGDEATTRKNDNDLPKNVNTGDRRPTLKMKILK